MQLSRKDFTSVKHLAAERVGGFNKGVVLVKCRVNNGTYIEKRIGKREVVSGHAAREVRAMKKCNHKNIIKLFFADLNHHEKGYASIYMTHCELGSLEDLIQRFAAKRERMSEGFLFKIFWDMSKALAYLQLGTDGTRRPKNEVRELSKKSKKKGWEFIFHRDLKPANIFLTNRHASGHYPTLVLGDFGCSIMEKDVVHPDATAATPAFAPPEHPYYFDSSDVYSLALCVHCAAEARTLPSSDRPRLARNPAWGYGGQLNGLLARCLRDRPTRLGVERLPYLVAREMKAARREREKKGTVHPEGLPSWAFGSGKN